MIVIAFLGNIWKGVPEDTEFNRQQFNRGVNPITAGWEDGSGNNLSYNGWGEAYDQLILEKLRNELMNEEMTVLELSNKLQAYDLDDIYNYGTINYNILEEHCIAVDEKYLIDVQIIEELEDTEIAEVKITDVTLI